MLGQKAQKVPYGVTEHRTVGRFARLYGFDHLSDGG